MQVDQNERGHRASMLLAVLALFGALLILHRWMVTPLGVGSYGRVWHLYVSYFDVGLNRRLLEGTLIKVTGLSRPFGVYEFAYLWHTLKLGLLAVLLYKTLQRRLGAEERWFQAALFLSPALLWHLAYVPGNHDLTVVIIAFASLYFDMRRVGFLVVLCLGVLTNETFVFLLPVLVLIYELKNGEWKVSPARSAICAGVLIAIPCFLYLALLLIGKQHPPELSVYEGRMAAVLGPAAYKHNYWSGYYELFGEMKSAIAETRQDLAQLPSQWKYLLLPLAYVLALAFAVFVFASGQGVLIGVLIAGAVLFPLAMSYPGNDFYRWISFSSTASLLAMCYLLKQPRSGVVQLNVDHFFAALLPLSLLGPFGSNPTTDPFPVARFIAEKLHIF